MKWDPIRLKLLEDIKDQGINPYPHSFQVTMSIPDIRIKFSNINKNIHEPFAFDVSTAGRVANVRRHGKASFVDLFDEGEKLQLYLRVNELGDRYEWFLKFVGRGDIVGVRGDIFYTMKGELSLLVKDFSLLAKALIEPPDWSYMTPEFRYAHRYVDFLYNDKARRSMEIRFKTMKEIRRFLDDLGFVEVDTPVIQPVYGGALAKPFRTHINYLNEDWYLRISLELYLKRLIVGGFNKIYEIGKVFRNEDIDVTHNPEFSLLELYWAYADYNDIMRLTESLISEVTSRVLGSTRITFAVGGEERQIDLTPPFRRFSMIESLSEALGRDVESMSDDQLKELMHVHNLVPRGGEYVRGLMIEKLFDKLVSPKLIQPTFITDHPAETTPLCKPHRTKKGLIERFELYIASMEIANAYTELNDPILQSKFFEEEQERLRKGDQEAHPYDRDFIRAISYGMPPTGGLGIGIDRVVMLLSGNISIKEVIPFPMVSAKEVQGD